MILAIVLVVYAVSVLFATRLIAGHLAWKWKSRFVDRPEGLDWFGAVCFGLMGGLVWPALLLVRGVRRLQLPAVGAESDARERLHQEELERSRLTAEAHLAELERSIDEDPATEDG
jgi:hypothetical protein